MSETKTSQTNQSPERGVMSERDRKISTGNVRFVLDFDRLGSIFETTVFTRRFDWNVWDAFDIATKCNRKLMCKV